VVYYGGHSIQEVAKILGLPLGTAKSRVYYGLPTLRLALQDRGRDQAGADALGAAGDDGDLLALIAHGVPVGAVVGG